MIKLSGEIDRTLKKIVEGIEVFDDMWAKVHSAVNCNVKEKHEAELKKEIKKLQRLRDFVKSWITSNDIKDKNVLLEHKKLIENKMEQFKVIERETKTKAYSTVGLGTAVKVDPKEKEKDDIRMWLSNQIDALNIQVDQIESSIEAIISKKKKLDSEKQEQVDNYRCHLEQHRFHIGRLELTMRLVDNDALDISLINKIKESVEYYVSLGSDPTSSSGPLNSDDSMMYLYDELNLDEVGWLVASTSISSSFTSTTTTTTTTTSTTTTSYSSTTTTTSLSSSSTATTTSSSTTSSSSSSSSRDPVSVAAMSLKQLSITAAARSNNQSDFSKIVNGQSQQGMPTPSTAPTPFSSSSSASSSSLPSSSSSSFLPTSLTSLPTMYNTSSSSSSVLNSTMTTTTTILASAATTTTITITSGNYPLQQLQPPSSTNNQSNLSVNYNNDSSSSLLVNPPQSNSTKVIRLHPLLGVAPLGTQPLDKYHRHQLVMLGAAINHIPYEIDSEQIRPCLPRNVYNSPTYYTPASHLSFDSIEFFNQLHIETLFFVFYFMEGTKAQHLAAKALKLKSWRFHTKCLMWFQRFEEPKIINEDYEQGSYLYFDFEAWAQRQREDFTFEYKYLEDHELN
ncbi:hypothetical protein HELRODRAFT_113765 [Helobdella robusta]|uniref:CCR4-NOT transcription complex subunit 3 n=1 Tax=Helobdella robusta TaxID=6412 RepID=T1EFW0_HELRO|nr:hypothetical protein HELRODRAFT_113765 [Helobdella robusta]ESN98451.1 hypothetical protein HELRODRAFT_113765 [Helobdella robusta]